MPLAPEVIARREEIARRVLSQIAPLSRSLSEMSEEERRAVFYKLEHEERTDLTGTDLKPVVEPSERFTLAVPRTDSLDKLAGKLQSFGSDPLRRGHPPHEALGRIRSIVEGQPTDRLSQALLEQYEDLTRQDWVVCEIEMISLKGGRRQQRAELLEIRRALDSAFRNRTLGNFFEHEDIKGTCRAVIRCTGSLFKELVEGRYWQCRIWWFDARPEFETFVTQRQRFSVERLSGINGPRDDAPIVCIVDSGVTDGNPFLRPVTRTELLRSFLGTAPENPYDEYGHGSGVASLAAYYALNLEDGARNDAKVWIASARVLDSHNCAEEGRLFSRVLSEVVDVFEPLGVRIFNLAVNIPNRKWNAESKRTVPRKSWVARTIDRLARERDVIFTVSAGNLSPADLQSWIREGKPYPAYFAEEDAHILDPGQAALAITVGALAPGTLSIVSDGRVSAVASADQPAPFTRCGPGVVKEIKPELVEYGGNYVQDSESNVVRRNPGTDIVMASHQVTPPLAYGVGTSFAVPRVAYRLALIQADLEELGLESISACLLKAFLVNSARWEALGDEFSAFQAEMDRLERNSWLMVAGYGLADHDRATYCDDFSCVAFHQGTLDPDTVAYFDVPVPVELAAGARGTKRLTVTVVHAPEVQRWGLERYLGTTFRWRMFRGDVDQEEIIRSMSIEEDSPEQAERPTELPYTIGVQAHSRGTVQHDVITWQQHQERYSTGNYTLAIAAYKKWARAPVPYAVVVRLEDTTRSAFVYSSVQRVLAEAEVEARSRAGAP